MNKKSGSNPRPFRVCKAWFPYSRLDGLDSYFATIWAIQTTRTIISKRGLKLIKHVIWLTVSTSLPFTLALPLGEARFLGTPKLPSWRRVHASRKFNFDLGVDRTVINVEGLSVTRNRSCLSRCAKCALRLTIEVYFRGVREGKPTFPSKINCCSFECKSSVGDDGCDTWNTKKSVSSGFTNAEKTPDDARQGWAFWPTLKFCNVPRAPPQFPSFSL